MKAERFAGIRAAIGVELTVGGRGPKGLVGVSLGAQLSIEGRAYPLFPPTTGSPSGVCDRCHQIEAELAFVAKDLKIQDVLFGGAGREVTLLDQVFKHSLGKRCAITRSCRYRS